MAQPMAVSTRPRPWRGPLLFSGLMHLGIVVALSLNLSLCTRPAALPPVPEHVRAVVVERAASRPVAPPVAGPEPPRVAPVPPPPAPKPATKPVPVPKLPRAEPKASLPAKPVPAAPAPAPRPVAPPAAKAPVMPVANFDDLLAQEDLARKASDAAQRDAAEKLQREATARSRQEQKIVNDYTTLIRAEIERRWKRPPGARGGLQAELHITLLPGGQVHEVRLLRASGDSAFDRSAENAVRLAGQLPVPADPVVFNAYFRSFKFLFRPEGQNP